MIAATGDAIAAAFTDLGNLSPDMIRQRAARNSSK